MMKPINRHSAEELLEKYAKGLCTEEELSIIDSWYLHYEHEGRPGLEEIQLDMIQASTAPAVTVRRLWSRLMAVAAAVAVIISGAYFYMHRAQSRAIVSYAEVSPVVEPGKIGATLTLSTGEAIDLSSLDSGKVAAETGITVRKSAGGELVYEAGVKPASVGQFNTLSTARGQRFLVVLPDQSKVWLNAASSLKYSTALGSDAVRQVELSGEGYFQVNRDMRRPFVVNSQNQRVEVLGTHFNIKAYASDKRISTTLLEGSVRINASMLLAPGEMAINTAGTLDKRKADTSFIVAWVNNDFHFANAKTGEVMEDMARWYDITVSYASPDIRDIPVSGHLSRDRSLNTILERMGAAAHLHFTVSGKHVYIEKQKE